MTSTTHEPWFCRFCGGPLPAHGRVAWSDTKGHVLTFCSQPCCDDFKAKTTRPDAPRSKRRRIETQ